MKRLHIPLSVQHADSREFGLATLEMLLAHHKQRTSFDELQEQIDTDPEFGTYLPQLGVHLLDRGFAVEIITPNSGLLQAYDPAVTRLDLIERAKDLRRAVTDPATQGAYSWYATYLQNGGALTPRRPLERDFSHELKRNRPVIAVYAPNTITDPSAKPLPHYALVTGIEHGRVYVNDPSVEAGGKKHYQTSAFLKAIAATASCAPDDAAILKAVPRS